MYFPRQYRRTIIKQTRQLLSEGDNTSLFGEKELFLSQDTITVTGKNETEQLKLSNIKKIRQHDDMALLYNSSISAIIVPTRGLTQEEIKRLTELRY